MTQRLHVVAGLLVPFLLAAALTPPAHAQDPVITIDASFEPCPTGHTKVGHECLREETEPATYVCPPDWTLSGSTCSHTDVQSAARVCAAGYALQPDNSCKRTETQPAIRRARASRMGCLGDVMARSLAAARAGRCRGQLAYARPGDSR